MIKQIRELLKYRELLYIIIWRDIRIKYKQSIMGIMWAIFMPLIIVAAGLLVRYSFSLLSNKPIRAEDFAGVSVKAIPWAFFVSSVRFSANSLIGNANLLTKIYFPRVVFPLAAVFSQLFDFLIASFLLIIILTCMQVGVGLALIWVPFLVFFLILLTIGFGILLSAANLFFRDVKYLVEVILTFAIFITPVFYEVSFFGKWANLLMLNPIAPILEGIYSTVVIHRNPDPLWMLYSLVFSTCIFLVAFRFFKKVEPLFAERI
jgi:lipopolysaccharide transport system permease protein